MTPAQVENAVEPEGALLLALESSMGTETQQLLEDALDALIQQDGNGLTVKGDSFDENYRSTEQLLILFPAEPINGLTGMFVLSLTPSAAGSFSLRHPLIEARNGDFVWTAEMKNDTSVIDSWSYTRHPRLRTVYLPFFDDPDELSEGQIFHQVPLRAASSPDLAATHPNWEASTISLSPSLIGQSVPIDHCEQLLQRMDSVFNIGEGEFLHWRREEVTLAALDRVAADVEASGLLGPGEKFNLTLTVSGEETTRNKRVRPVASYPVTLFDQEGTPAAATIGCSLSRQ